MKKITVFGHKHCKDCSTMKALLFENGLEFEFADVTEGMPQIKEFIRYRDTRAEFDRIKRAGGIGFPCVVVNNGEVILFGDLEIDYLKELVKE